MNKIVYFILVFLCTMNASLTNAAWIKLPESKTPWAFWALLDQMGGAGYSYADKSIFFLSHFEYQRERADQITIIGEYDFLQDYYQKLNQAELNKLSPIEKLSLLSERNLIELESLIKDDMRLFADSWWGNCDGVAAASLLYPEPKKSLTLKTKNGTKITLSIADQKTILATYAKYSKSETFHFTNEGNDQKNLKVFQPHLILETLEKQFKNNNSVLIDISHGPEKWNSAVYAFEKNIFKKNILSSHHHQEFIELKIKVAFAGTKTILNNPNLINNQYVFKDHPQYSTQISVHYILETKDGIQTSSFNPHYPENKIDYLSIVYPELELKDEYYNEYRLDPDFFNTLLKAMSF